MEKHPTTYSKETKTLALFDFDGTITRNDTLIRFIIYTYGKFRFLLGMIWLLPFLVIYKLGLYSNEKAKQRMLSFFYKRWNYAEFKRKGEDFCRQVLPGLLRESALQKIQWHKKKMHRIIVVTASVEEWVHPWCESIGIECLCTQLEIKDNHITGRLGTPNCYGPEKVNRVKNILSLDQYETIYAYGDTKGDREMLKISGKPYFRHFDD